MVVAKHHAPLSMVNHNTLAYTFCIGISKPFTYVFNIFSPRIDEGQAHINFNSPHVNHALHINMPTKQGLVTRCNIMSKVKTTYKYLRQKHPTGH